MTMTLNIKICQLCAYLEEALRFLECCQTIILRYIQRYPRVIVALILSPLLSRTLNFWATALFMEVLTFDTQIYLQELLVLEKLLDY